MNELPEGLTHQMFTAQRECHVSWFMVHCSEESVTLERGTKWWGGSWGKLKMIDRYPSAAMGFVADALGSGYGTAKDEAESEIGSGKGKGKGSGKGARPSYRRLSWTCHVS